VIVAEPRVHPESDRLHVAVEDAIGAFAEARAAFERLEATHDPTAYQQVTEHLRILGDTLASVRGEALTFRLHVAERLAHQ
jgi:hypothetical protein